MLQKAAVPVTHDDVVFSSDAMPAKVSQFSSVFKVFPYVECSQYTEIGIEFPSATNVINLLSSELDRDPLDTSIPNEDQIREKLELLFPSYFGNGGRFYVVSYRLSERAAPSE
ncbi:hypothetical protein GCM10007148_28510 [Parvularcula lutaonensis]|nr:hypothetical protein GCM10007148_28510 [Parvularcula lutaonensis]